DLDRQRQHLRRQRRRGQPGRPRSGEVRGSSAMAKARLVLAGLGIAMGIAAAAFASAASPSAFAAGPGWEVGVIFLHDDFPAEYPADVDRNLLELARLAPGPGLRLSIYRELPDHAVQYQVDPGSSQLTPWDALFSKSPLPGVQVP